MRAILSSNVNAYDTWTCERATSEFAVELSGLANTEVRVVSDPIQHAGDLRLDEGEEGTIFGGVWLFAAGLQVLGSLENRDVTAGPRCLCGAILERVKSGSAGRRFR